MKLKRTIVISVSSTADDDQSSDDDEHSGQLFDRKASHRCVAWSENSHTNTTANTCANTCAKCEQFINTKSFSSVSGLYLASIKPFEFGSSSSRDSDNDGRVNDDRDESQINSIDSLTGCPLIRLNSNLLVSSLPALHRISTSLSESHQIGLNGTQQTDSELNTPLIENCVSSSSASEQSFSDDNSSSVTLQSQSLFDIRVAELKIDAIDFEGNSLHPFKCRVCGHHYASIYSAESHARSDFHFKRKFGDQLTGVDALFTIDSDRIGNLEVVIARNNELRQISDTTKVEYARHGIRLRDGIGDYAYICLSCDIAMSSLSKVRDHMQRVDQISRLSLIDDCVEDISVDSSVDTDLIDNFDIAERFKEEGIIYKRLEFSSTIQFMSRQSKCDLHCLFCDIYFDSENTAIQHLEDPKHERAKNGENLSTIDSNFTVKSYKNRKFEFALARKSTLTNLSKELKVRYTSEGIRLKDGIGFDAFICQNCCVSISSLNGIESHIEMDDHKHHNWPLILL